MATSSACAACRLRAVIRHHALARQGRATFSSSALHRQDEQSAEYVDSLHRRFDRSLNQSHAPRNARNEPRGKFQRQQVTQEGVVRRGRYSGQPMYEDHDVESQRPQRAQGRERRERRARRVNEQSAEAHQPYSQQLLEDLVPSERGRAPPPEEGYEPAEAIPDEDEQGVDSVLRESNSFWLGRPTQARLSKNAVKAGEAFLNATEDSQRWSSLQQLMQNLRNQGEFQALSRDNYFSKHMFHWILKMNVHYAASLGSSSAKQQLPSPSILLRLRAAMTQKPSTLWPHALWNLAKACATARAIGDEQSSQQGLDELMAVWSVCMKAQQQRGRPVTRLQSLETLLERPSIDFSFLPDAATFRSFLQERDAYYTLEDILHFLAPVPTMSSQKEFDYPSAALVTLDMLRKDESAGKAFGKWVAVMEVAVDSVTTQNVHRALLAAARESEGDESKAYFSSVMSTFGGRKTPQRAANESNKADGSTTPTSSEHDLFQNLDRPPALTETSTDFDRWVFQAIRNLGRAFESNKLVYAQRTWANVQENAAKYPNIPIPQFLFHHLLLTFTALRDQGTVIELWQAMVKRGHQPTVQTYSIVMQGCRHIGNAQMLETFWTSMRRAGLQPDSHAWSTRIFSLIKSRQFEPGLRALSEMGQDWIAAARRAHTQDMPAEMRKKRKGGPEISTAELVQLYPGDVNGVPRPNQVVMNSAVSGLAAMRDVEIPKVLSWARSFNLEPELTTYNALLNVAMRRGKPDEALHILRRMDGKGITADSTTWTVLLTALFEGGYLDDLAPQEQQDKIMAFIASLEGANAAGVDAKGYALVIDRLIKRHANPAAADAVLAHMAARGTQPTAHIYTILMGFHFAATPAPDLRAIEALWHRIRTANNGYGVPLDAQFYDRMIEGYAVHHVAAGSTKGVTHFLQRMRNEGKRPSWTALTCALRAFADREEWDRAQALVARVRRDMEGSRQVGQRFGQREFWRLVVGMGLLEGSQVPKVREVAA